MHRGIALVLLLACLSSSAKALEVAKYVVAEEITGAVVDADTGKPVPGAVVAMRFERYNTGHSGPHCFRSMAVETDHEGRFRFAPWKQENTRANGTLGELQAYKVGYAVPRAVQLHQDPRPSLFGMAFSDTIKIPKSELRIEVRPFKGSDEERLWQISQIASQYSCRWQAESDDMLLLMRVREEIVSSSFADLKLRGWSFTASRWIDDVIANKGK
jgi:hypothetical protein